MMSELIAAADAGFQNIWSLQSCIDTLYEFGDEEQRQKFIPRICEGEMMSWTSPSLMQVPTSSV